MLLCCHCLKAPTLHLSFLAPSCTLMHLCFKKLSFSLGKGQNRHYSTHLACWLKVFAAHTSSVIHEIRGRHNCFPYCSLFLPLPRHHVVAKIREHPHRTWMWSSLSVCAYIDYLSGWFCSNLTALPDGGAVDQSTLLKLLPFFCVI